MKIAIAKRQIAGQYMAFINTRNAPLNNKKVRQALLRDEPRRDADPLPASGFGKISGRSHLLRTADSIPPTAAPTHDPARAEKMLTRQGRAARRATGSRCASASQSGGAVDVAPDAHLFRQIGVDLKVMA